MPFIYRIPEHCIPQMRLVVRLSENILPLITTYIMLLSCQHHAHILSQCFTIINKKGQVIIVNSSTNSLKDLIINFFLKATTSKAKYLSIDEMKKLFKSAKLKVKKIEVIRERFYMPTIALFHTER